MNEENTAKAIPRPSREKTWDECGIEEKVERLRRVLRDNQRITQAVNRVAQETSELARGHQHNATTGEVLESVNRNTRHGGAEVAGRYFDHLE